MPKLAWLVALAVALIASAPAHADPISGAIAAATAVGGAISSMGAVGTFLVNGALAVGASYLSRALGKKTTGKGASSSAVTLELSLDADHPRQLVFGSRVVGGSLHYRCKYGPQNENIDLVIVLADHEIDSLQQVWVNGIGISMHMDAAGWQDVPEFSDKYGVSMLSFRLYKGGADQPADTEVIGDSGGQWTGAHRLRGCAWVKVRIVFNPEVWGSALPTFKWLINGAKLYDLRLDSTVPGGDGPMRWGQPETYRFADNLELARYNFLRGIYVGGDKWFGVGLEASEIPLDHVHAAIAACAEPVLTRAGSYEPRYRVAAVIDADEPWRDVLAKFSLACAGNLPDLAGRYALLPGVAQVPVLHITDDDFIVGTELTGSRHRPLDEVVCEVTGNWASPEALYESTALPTRYSSADEEADGGFRRSAPLDLSYVASQSQGQRCMEITRRLARRQITHKGTLRRRCDVLEAGDWIYWTSAKFGYSARVFRVEAANPNDDLSVTVQLREIDSGVYGWSPDDEQDPNNPTDLPSGGAGGAVVVNVAVAIAQVNGIDGTQAPGIRVTWNPITDPTVYSLVIEYRRVGDAPWQTFIASEPQVREGAATITAGIIGGDFYQVRLTPLTSPPRVVDVSAIATTASNTVEIIVNRALVSTVAEAVRPGSITNDALEAQFRDVFDASRYANLDVATVGLLVAAANVAEEKEISLRAVNALRADVALGLNPVSAGIERIDQKAAEITAAFATADLAITAQIAGVAAELQNEESARVTQDSALAQRITDISAQFGSDIAGVQQAITAQAAAGELLASDTRSLYVQDIQGDDAALVAQLVEMAARGEDVTALLRKNNVATASIEEVRSATVANGVATATLSAKLLAEIGDRGAAISQEMTARTSADAVLSTQITTLIAQERDERASSITQESAARANGDSALATQITTIVAQERTDRAASVSQEAAARADADTLQAIQTATLVAQERTDRGASIQAEATARTNGDAVQAARTDSLVAQEATDRAGSIQQEATARSNAVASLATTVNTLVAQERTDRAASVSQEAAARADADTLQALQTATLVAQESQLRHAALVSEQQARVDGDGALASSINYVNARVNGVDAGGQYGVVAVAGINGAAATYRVFLNAGSIATGMWLDAMSGGTSRVVFETGAFQIRDPWTGDTGPIFSYEAGNFLLNGNVRVNGALVVTGSITSLQISEFANLNLQNLTAASQPFGNGTSDWFNVGPGIDVNVPSKGGYSFPMVHIVWNGGATNLSAGTTFIDVRYYFRILCNGAVVAGGENPTISTQLKPSQGLAISGNDFLFFANASGNNFFQIQMKHYQVGSGVGTGNFYVKIGVAVMGR